MNFVKTKGLNKVFSYVLIFNILKLKLWIQQILLSI